MYTNLTKKIEANLQEDVKEEDEGDKQSDISNLSNISTTSVRAKLAAATVKVQFTEK